MGVDKIEVRDNYEQVLKEIKTDIILMRSDVEQIKNDLVEVKENTKKELL